MEAKTMSLRELDVLVAEKVMGWQHITEDTPYRLHQHRGGVIVNGIAQKFGAFGGIPNDWHPAGDIAAAWQLLELLDRPTVWHFRDEADGLEKWAAQSRGTKANIVTGVSSMPASVAATAPLAITLAALKAHGIDPAAPSPE